jgi:GxxExxY protein
MLTKLMEEELSFKLRGIFIDISKNYGCYYKEKIYQNLLRQEFRKNMLNFFEHPKITIFDFNTGNSIGHIYPDFLIQEKIIVEIKAQQELNQSSVNQLTKYLRTSKYELGLLVNFGTPKAQVFRRIYTNDRKIFLSLMRH